MTLERTSVIIIHIGLEHPVNIETVDLGVTMDSKLRFDKHITAMVNKVHIRAALIRHSFRSRDKKLLFWAIIVFVWPVLKYCSPVWNSYYSCDVEKIKSVQCRFIKYIGSLKSFT